MAGWVAAQFGRGLDRRIPAKPGLYAIAITRRLYGLPVTVEWLYVGQSVDLKRRWREHVGPHEPNKTLLKAARKGNAEFWFRVFRTNELDALELELIHHLRPVGNTRGKPKTNRNGK